MSLKILSADATGAVFFAGVSDAGPFEHAPASLLIGDGFSTRLRRNGGLLRQAPEHEQLCALMDSLYRLQDALEDGAAIRSVDRPGGGPAGARGALGVSFCANGLMGQKFEAPLFGPGEVALVINEALDWRPALAALVAWTAEPASQVLEPLPVRRVLYHVSEPYATTSDGTPLAHHSTSIENDSPTSGARRGGAPAPIVAPAAR